MNVITRLSGAAAAFLMLGSLAFADVSVSTSTNPAASLKSEMSSLLNSEHAILSNLRADELSAVAKGPLPAVVVRTVPGAAEAPVPEVDYSYSWLMAQDVSAQGAEWDCLRQALYFEARGESLEGQFAVAEVILNRVDSGVYPDSVCDVVGQRGGGSCQFSYVCDGHPDNMREAGAAEVAGRIASVMLEGGERGLTEGATYFHSRAVNPSWARRFTRTAAIGAHLFYASN